MRYKVKSHFLHNGRLYEPGAEVDLATCPSQAQLAALEPVPEPERPVEKQLAEVDAAPEVAKITQPACCQDCKLWDAENHPCQHLLGTETESPVCGKNADPPGRAAQENSLSEGQPEASSEGRPQDSEPPSKKQDSLPVGKEKNEPSSSAKAHKSKERR
jgi:hypothetical protein